MLCIMVLFGSENLVRCVDSDGSFIYDKVSLSLALCYPERPRGGERIEQIPLGVEFIEDLFLKVKLL